MAEMSGLRGHRTQNAERAEGRRRDILVAAAHVFARDGYNKASLEDVAANIGVTKGVIYYYFRSKEEIFTEIRATAIRDAIERLKAIIAEGEPPALMLRAAIGDLVRHIFDDLDRYANILSSGEKLSPESHTLVRNLQREYEQLIREIVQHGIREGVLVAHDPRVMTFTMLRACLSIADWYSPDGPLSPDLIARQVSAQVMAGVIRRGAGDQY